MVAFQESREVPEVPYATRLTRDRELLTITQLERTARSPKVGMHTIYLIPF